MYSDSQSIIIKINGYAHNNGEKLKLFLTFVHKCHIICTE